jgi:hypothetical protein
MGNIKAAGLLCDRGRVQSFMPGRYFEDLPGYKKNSCSYPRWHCNGRICRIVLTTAAEEYLHDLVDDEQG